MTIKLILMRHAKSAWDEPEQDDFDRPLNKRGRRQAPLIGEWLKQNGHVPDLALVSTAARTRETWELVSGALPDTEAEFRQDLYLAAPTGILAALKTATVPTVLILGHNPGMARTASLLVKDAPNDDEFARYPTLATSVVAFDAEAWSGIGEDTGTLSAFIVPRRLEG